MRKLFKIFNWAIFTTLLTTAIAPIRPYLTQYTFDHFVANGDKLMLLYMTIVLIALLMLEGILNLLILFLQTL